LRPTQSQAASITARSFSLGTGPSYGLATVRYPVLEVTATVEPFENGRGFSLRVLRAGKPRQKTKAVTKEIGLPMSDRVW